MEATDTRVSRRTLLKRASVGVAALGAGSLLTAQAASAKTGVGDPKCARLSWAHDDPACGACEYQRHCGSNCGCVVGTDGCCFCHQSISCSGATSCETDHHCPPGWKCAHTCCGEGEPICVPPCGTLLLGPTGGPMSSNL